MDALVIGFWFICGLGAAAIAANKNRSAFGWFVAGVVFGPIALLVVGFMSPESNEIKKMKRCPFCSELVMRDAIICRYCNHDIHQPICSVCGIKMKFKRPTSGPRAGEIFYVCPNYKICGQIMPVEEQGTSISSPRD